MAVLLDNSHGHMEEMPCLLWNPKVCYCVHRSLPLIHILLLIETVHLNPVFLNSTDIKKESG
jgi:hypothetical protein